MFEIPPLHVCQKYEHEIKNLESSFEEIIIASRRRYPILDRFSNKRYSSAKNNTVRITYFFPYWLSENYILDNNLKRSIIIAELCYSESILIYDSLLDNSKRLSSLQRKSIQLVANVFLVEGTSILKKIFAPNSYFWILHNHFMVEYWNVIAWEKAYCSKRRRWSDREIELLGKKLSFLKVTAAAFACLANDTTQLKIVERLLEQFHIGMQMIDDIDDWKEDISENNYTYFASQMFRISNKARRKIRHRQNTALLRTLNVSLHYIRLARGCAVKLSLSSFTEFLNIILEAVNHLTSLNKNYFRDIIEKGASTYMLINPN